MDAKEYIAAIVVAAGSGGAGAYAAPLVSGWFARRQKRDELEAAHRTSVETKEAITGDMLLQHLAARQDSLEKRLDESERRADRYERVLERVARGYDDIRRMVLRLVRCNREGRTPPPELLDDLEKTPDIHDLLKGVLKLDH